MSHPEIQRVSHTARLLVSEPVRQPAKPDSEHQKNASDVVGSQCVKSVLLISAETGTRKALKARN